MAPLIGWAAALIEFGGALIVAVAVARTLILLGAGAGIDQARLALIAGSLGALDFKTAASLLKVLELATWHSVGAFAAILTLRTLIKRLFQWEQARLVTPYGARLQNLHS